MTTWGYARVSTEDQELGQQLTALEIAGVSPEHIFQEKVSAGKDRPELENLLNIVVPGDKIIVFSVDRFSRSIRQLVDLVHKLSQKSVGIKFLRDGIDTADDNPMAKAMLHLMGVFAELERELIRHRIKQGIKRRKLEGKPVGRKRWSTPERVGEISRLRARGFTWSEIARQFGVHQETVERAWRRREKGLT